MTRKVIFIISTIAVFVSVFLLSCTVKGKARRFKEVSFFEEAAILCDAHLSFLCMDISTPLEFVSAYHRAEANPIFPWGNVIQQNQKIYLASHDFLFEFSNEFVLLRQIPVNAFNLPCSDTHFVGPIDAFQDNLWLTVKSKEKAECRFWLIRWDVSTPPDNRILMLEIDASRWTINHDDNLIYVPPKGIYNYETESFEEKRGWGHYSFSSISRQQGVLLSSGVDKSPEGAICLVAEEGVKILPCFGFYAQWGKDESIYYIKKQNELWKYDLSTKSNELLILLKRNLAISPTSLAFNENGKYLAFYYYNPKNKSQKGTMVLDLINQEYRDMKGSGF